MKVFNNKTILVTGHTGFKGSWLCIWLNSLGARVVGLSDNEIGIPSNFLVSSVSEIISDYRCDIRDTTKLESIINKIQPDFVFHLAAQALVRLSYENPVDTITINSIGSVNILNALKNLDKKVVAVMITSDKAYDNVEWLWGYKETDRLGGKDPYSASKGMAELAIRCFVESFFKSSSSNVRVGIARAGNVIGGGDWAIDRIVPDCMRAWSKGEVVEIRNPNATRPWQHVLEPLSGYLCLASNLYYDATTHGEAFNFGPSADQNHQVKEVISEMSKYWNQVNWKDVSRNGNHLHEAFLLKLNCDKALFNLKWHSALSFNDTVKMTIEWYKKYYQNKNQSMHDFSITQIEEYSQIAKLNNISWTKDD
jgi:CDP-glucose 4,6-dehydratase